MGFYDRLKTDNQRLLGSEDEMRDVTLYNSANESLSGQARFTSPGMDINMQGQVFATRKNTIGFHIDDFASLMGENENFEGWQAEFLNSQGETVKGRFNNPLINKTFGYVEVALVNNKVAG